MTLKEFIGNFNKLQPNSTNMKKTTPICWLCLFVSFNTRNTRTHMPAYVLCVGCYYRYLCEYKQSMTERNVKLEFEHNLNLFNLCARGRLFIKWMFQCKCEIKETWSTIRKFVRPLQEDIRTTIHISSSGYFVWIFQVSEKVNIIQKVSASVSQG